MKDSEIGSSSSPKYGRHAVDALRASRSSPFRIRRNRIRAGSKSQVLWQDSRMSGASEVVSTRTIMPEGNDDQPTDAFRFGDVHISPVRRLYLTTPGGGRRAVRSGLQQVETGVAWLWFTSVRRRACGPPQTH